MHAPLLLTVIFKLHTGVFPGGCRPPDPPHGRAGGVSGGPILGCIFSLFVFFYFLFAGFRPREIAHLFSHEISRRMPSESCLGTPWDPSYEHIYKNMIRRGGGRGWLGSYDMIELFGKRVISELGEVKVGIGGL